MAGDNDAVISGGSSCTVLPSSFRRVAAVEWIVGYFAAAASAVAFTPVFLASKSPWYVRRSPVCVPAVHQRAQGAARAGATPGERARQDFPCLDTFAHSENAWAEFCFTIS